MLYNVLYILGLFGEMCTIVKECVEIIGISSTLLHYVSPFVAIAAGAACIRLLSHIKKATAITTNQNWNPEQ